MQSMKYPKILPRKLNKFKFMIYNILIVECCGAAAFISFSYKLVVLKVRLGFLVLLYALQYQTMQTFVYSIYFCKLFITIVNLL